MTPTNELFLTVDGIKVPFAGEKNILEVVRKANIEIPTFCYHSQLSVYGACRMCMVEVEGRGLMASCSVKPEPGLKIRTNTAEIREIRKTNVELVLASHEQTCPTCDRSDNCKLRALSAQLGITKNRFKTLPKNAQVDRSSPSLVRDPNKCVLCGDCVRYCSEIQGIGAIDFSHRGSSVQVGPGFGKMLAQVECINCGQCATVCPVGAITPASEIDAVQADLADPRKNVVVQVAPAVRVAIGEMFNQEPGKISTGQIVAALKMLGFKKVYDTSFTADMTVLEETTEFLARKQKNEKLPIFTSCCPGWVKYAEQYYPTLLSNLSTCKSPQQMFGAVAKETMGPNTVVVSIMPCTAKKFEAKRPEFKKNGTAEVDHVLTTQELGRMIKQAGIRFEKLQSESMDMPFGLATGAGVIFGNSGGVSEAVLRFAYEKVTGSKLEDIQFSDVRGTEGLREAAIDIQGTVVKLAVVSGLKNAKTVADRVVAGEADYDIIEVMACPGGCVAGAGQPVPMHHDTQELRTQGLYNADRENPLHKAQENPYLQKCYEEALGGVVGHGKAHELLHTKYASRKRGADDSLELNGAKDPKVKVSVCMGTGCFLKGSQDLLSKVMKHVNDKGLKDSVELRATFCMEKCDRGPSVKIGDEVLRKTEVAEVMKAISESLGEKL